jgi:very-short-patch-repair endonuclease
VGIVMTAEELAKLEHWVERQAPDVRCVFAIDPRVLPVLLESIGARCRPFTGLGIESGPGDALPDHLESLVQVMADAVLARYPQLYQSAMAQLSDPWVQTATQLVIEQVGSTEARVSSGWLRRTLEACRAGRSPRHPEYALVAEAEQLALCLDPRRLVIAWVVRPEEITETRLLGLSRAAEWLQAATGALVLLGLGAAWRGRQGLDPIAYDALTLDAVVEPPATGASAVAPEQTPEGESPDGESPDGTLTARDSRSGPALVIRGEPIRRQHPHVTGLWPVIGRPHPLSPAEQVFAEALARDAELAPKFTWNQVVVTTHDTRPIVDLLWSERRLVVEIDGYAHHSSRLAFERDRQRDWELLVSGYRVFRIPASEVSRNTAASIEKLRALTRSLAQEKS